MEVRERIPASVVSTRSDTTRSFRPKLLELPRADVRRGLPRKVRIYEDSLTSLRGFEVREIELTHRTARIRTTTREYEFAIPPQGETVHVRNDQVDPTRPESLLQYVEGTPKPQRIERRRPGLLQQMTSLIKWAVCLALVTVILLVFFRLRRST